ncbi:MAG TPA: NAD-dependent epimerase/dehydratase family protein [Polyangiaceae bacterium]|jgi:nucleoside-diphosphate-sugar epimerase
MENGANALPDLLVTRPRRVGTLLLTGAPGWLTDRLAASLAERPPAGLTRVRCLVHPSHAVDADGYRRATGLDVEIVRGDLGDAGALRVAVEGVDSIVHAAGIIHVRRFGDYYDVNTEGTRRLAQLASQSGVSRFVYISTNAAGGRSTSAERLITEDDPPMTLNHYSRSKWLGEEALRALSTSMERVVLRPSMFYGPPVPPRHVEVFRRVMHGRMPLVGGGKQARSATHIDHLVQATRLALVHPEAPGRTYYVADREVYTTRGIVEGMARALGVEPRWIPLPGAVASLAFVADTQLSRLGVYWQTLHLVGESNWHVGLAVDRAERELGYSPLYGLDHGMHAAVAWCRERALL